MGAVAGAAATAVSAPGSLRQALLLGLLMALGPLAIDLYLPAFPVVARDLGASTSEVQASLVSFFFALGVGQLFYGALSDVFGRKGPLLLGLGLFFFASIACGRASDIHELVWWRFLQGFGACSGGAIARAVVRDLHTGPEAARLLGTMLLVLGVSPILAPVVGSALLMVVSWRTLFGIIAGCVAAAAILCVWALPETLAPEMRQRGGLSSLVSAFRAMRSDRRFLGLTVVCGMCTATVFVFLTASPFIYTQLHGVSPTWFGPLVGLNAATQILAAQFNRRLMHRFGAARQIRFASAAAAAVGSVFLVATLLHVATLAVIVGLCALLSGIIGFLLTPAGVLAMDGQGNRAGAASAVMGSCQLLIGALMAALVGAAADGTARPMAAVLAGCVLTAWMAVQLVTAPQRE